MLSIWTSRLVRSEAPLARVWLIFIRPGGCEFDTRLRRTFFPAYFHLSPLTSAEACEKSSRWLWKESFLVLV